MARPTTREHEATLNRLDELVKAIEGYFESLAALRVVTPHSNLDHYMNFARLELRHYGRR